MKTPRLPQNLKKYLPLGLGLVIWIIFMSYQVYNRILRTRPEISLEILAANWKFLLASLVLATGLWFWALFKNNLQVWIVFPESDQKEPGTNTGFQRIKNMVWFQSIKNMAFWISQKISTFQKDLARFLVERNGVFCRIIKLDLRKEIAQSLAWLGILLPGLVPPMVLVLALAEKVPVSVFYKSFVILPLPGLLSFLVTILWLMLEPEQGNNHWLKYIQILRLKFSYPLMLLRTSLYLSCWFWLYCLF